MCNDEDVELKIVRHFRSCIRVDWLLPTGNGSLDAMRSFFKSMPLFDRFVTTSLDIHLPVIILISDRRIFPMTIVAVRCRKSLTCSLQRSKGKEKIERG
jgi:hypothetical protein